LKLDLTKTHTFSNGIYDFMEGIVSIQVGGDAMDIELDYAWDYESDPVITETIIHEWKYLDHLVSKHVLRNVKSVLSIGGGGSSRTHEYLSTSTDTFAVLNTGKWDLENAKVPAGNVTSLLVRATGEDLPFLSNSVGAIEIPSTLDHVIDAKKVIEECFRVLVAGGRVGITLGNSKSWYRKLVGLLRISVTDNHEHHHNFHFTSMDVERLLSEAGFSSIQTVGSAYLKLPKSIERKLKLPVLLAIHRFISNKVLKMVFGNANGGMFLTFANKPAGI